MRFGEEFPAKYDLSSLRVLGTVGEPINPEAWLWYPRARRKGRVPDYRYLVANRDRPIYDGDSAFLPGQAGQSGQTVPPASSPMWWTNRATAVEDGKGGFLVIKSVWPGDDAHDLRAMWIVTTITGN